MRHLTFLVHGFNVPDKGADTILQTVPYLKDHSEVVNHHYGRLGLIGVYFKNGKIAEKLAQRSKRSRGRRSQFAVGHSNGCAIIVEAIRRGAKFKSILLINPALNVDTVFPPGDYTVTVIYTKHDKAVELARYVDGFWALGWMIPDVWGAMGSRGYIGDDTRVESLNYSHILGGHSHMFDKEIMRTEGPLLPIILYTEVRCLTS